jgi:hypothetical protein
MPSPRPFFARPLAERVPAMVLLGRGWKGSTRTDGPGIEEKVDITGRETAE